MSEKFRCINAFEFDDRIYPGGLEVDGDAAILQTHRAHFAAVESTSVTTVRTEVATAAPGELRDVAPTKRGPGRRKPVEAEPTTAPTSDDSEG